MRQLDVGADAGVAQRRRRFYGVKSSASLQGMKRGAIGDLWRRRGLRLASAALLALVLALAGLALLLPSADARGALASGDYRAARAALLPAAEAGDAWAQNALGNLAYLGLGAPRDYAAALSWYWKAASQGRPEAQVNLGHLYAQGLGVSADPLRAFAWYRQAEQSGSERGRDLMRLIAGSMQLTPNQVQKAKALYDRLEDLRP